MYRAVKTIHIDATNGVVITWGILRAVDGAIVASGLTQTQAATAVSTLNTNADALAGNLYFV